MKTLSKRYQLAIGLSIALSTSAANAGHARHADYAKVVNATPVYEQIRVQEPVEVCHIDRDYDRQPERQNGGSRNYTPVVLGGLIGGAIGNAVGHHDSNKKVGAVAGALLGASLGHNISSRQTYEQPAHHERYSERQHCEQEYQTTYQEKLVGYDVTYKYRGQHYTTRTDHHPGKRLRVAVDVRPME